MFPDEIPNVGVRPIKNRGKRYFVFAAARGVRYGGCVVLELHEAFAGDKERMTAREAANPFVGVEVQAF